MQSRQNNPTRPTRPIRRLFYMMGGVNDDQPPTKQLRTTYTHNHDVAGSAGSLTVDADYGGGGAINTPDHVDDIQYQKEEVAQKRAWHKASQPWFDYLKKNRSLLERLSRACRYYAFHLDRYLNSSCGRAVPLRDIQRHFVDEVNSQNETQWTVVHSQEPNNTCVGSNPFAVLAGQTSAELVDYLDLVDSVCAQMDQVFREDDASFQLQQPLVVYRGLRMRAGAIIDPRFVGYSSTATTRDSAYSIMIAGPRWFDATVEQAVLMRVTLPRGTRVINMNLCTIQDENEVLVLAQGRLVQTGRETIVPLETWRPEDKQNGVFTIPVKVVDYTLVVTADKPPLFRQVHINDSHGE